MPSLEWYIVGDFFHDIACHVIMQQPTITVTALTTASNTPAMRWCAYPGERLLKRVQQEVNGKLLPESWEKPWLVVEIY
jgi:hypothetical protein